MLVHTVYFWLKPDLPAAERAAFRRGVEALAVIASVDKFYVGTPAATEKRPAVDDSYSFAVTVLFKDLAAHNAYQVDPLHVAFLASWKASWTRALVYDAQ